MKRQLENWSIVMAPAVLKDAATIGRQLCGRVYGDPVLKDGTFVCTGVVTAEDPAHRTVSVGAETYELGVPYPFWVRWCVQHGVDLARMGIEV